MSHIPYTLLRSGMYYYNRRVPNKAKHLYGDFLRFGLSRHFEEAEVMANRVSAALNASWSDSLNVVEVNLDAILQSFKPRLAKLSEFKDEYVSWKSIHPKPLEVATNDFISLLGDRNVAEYSRDDVKTFVMHLLARGNKTTTVRRRLNSISAVLGFAYAELELERRNPASRVLIKGEGHDAFRRSPFTLEQLKQGYTEAIASKRSVRLLMPILGETGCRIGEIVGLRVQDICLNSGIIRIRPHSYRRLKTSGSERELPLVGFANEAMGLLLEASDGHFLFPRYLKHDAILVTHASNSLNRWLKTRFNGLTAHCLRHTMRDRLRAENTPLELIDQIGGWSSIRSVGAKYGQGYQLDMVRTYLERIKIRDES